MPLTKYNSWRVGGAADALFTPKNLEDLKNFLKDEHYLKPLTFIGLGSNILVRDGGIRGTVIVMHAALNEIQMTDKGVYAEAGNTCAKIAKLLLESITLAENFCWYSRHSRRSLGDECRMLRF